MKRYGSEVREKGFEEIKLSAEQALRNNYLEYVKKQERKRKESEVQSSKMTFGKNTPTMSEDRDSIRQDHPLPQQLPEKLDSPGQEIDLSVESSVALSSPEQEPMPYGQKSNTTFDLSVSNRNSTSNRIAKTSNLQELL